MSESEEMTAASTRSIIALMPELFRSPRPVFDGNSPLITAGSMFTLNDIFMLPVIAGLHPRWGANSRVMMYGAVGGYSLLKRVAETSPPDYYKMLWTPCSETVMWIASCLSSDSIDDLLRLVEMTRFGNVRVDHLRQHTLATLGDVVALIRNRSLTSDMAAASVGSKPVSISRDRPVREAIRKMLSHNVRRLMLDGRPREFVSDRSVVRFMFRSDRLFLARDAPQRWIDAKVSDLQAQKAGRLSQGGTIYDACKVMGSQPDDCLVTDDGRVVSRWDLVMKPWKAGRLKLPDGGPRSSGRSARSRKGSP
ncbi:MAG: CBS domain-containing protein [Nitrososphaerota archaeon]|nr:CBS domain-containing protein [Nitrososphaerota archaeon]